LLSVFAKSFTSLSIYELVKQSKHIFSFILFCPDCNKTLLLTRKKFKELSIKFYSRTEKSISTELKSHYSKKSKPKAAEKVETKLSIVFEFTKIKLLLKRKTKMHEGHPKFYDCKIYNKNTKYEKKIKKCKLEKDE